ncbi:helix-turn-helix domain-containing protein [Chryseobacterium rhizoplanae]|uniref:helix-turn-helix domain-containing protein n=1 Tax=Chryseobacterium rhizoplanae TaxID=1609531 RepID=UPI001CE2E383|nr:helix-turn-helix domain-containing protein [Chryseobacterium rhizoplanae]UCA61741.1 helix-turn-helix domain-containing protein [Chryseobacterium rhizoplanae]
MYYLELIQRFWEFGPKARLSTTAIALYLYLLKLANDNNGYDVTVSDVVVSDALGLTRKTVKSAKEKLRGSGLIQYESKKGYSCSYRIVLNYPLQIPGQEENQKVKSKKEEKNTILKYSKTVNGPSLEEFMAHACTLSGYDKSLDSDIKDKYTLWTNNDWRNNSGKPITKWKSSLKNILPYLKNSTDSESLSIETIPNIKHPK